MNLAPIAEIKAELRSMYPMFKFDMKPQQSTQSYSLIVFKGVERLGDMTINADTPMDVFWSRVREWMLQFIRNY